MFYYLILAFKKYATLEGRTSRKAYWMYSLTVTVILFAYLIITAIISGIIQAAIPHDHTANTVIPLVFSLINLLLFLATIIPNISIMIRRLHDTNKSGWWMWFTLLPVAGPIVLFVFACQKGDAGDNDYGQPAQDLPNQQNN
jgi:uncharacterized membrane protein YhaH (DUF805 family)